MSYLSAPSAYYSERFSKIFSTLEDPRRTNRGNFKYPMNEILFLTVSATLSGYSDFECVTDFGKLNLDWLRKFYPYQKGICSHDVIERAFQNIDYDCFSKCVAQWARESFTLSENELISIDGKRICGSFDTNSQKTADHILTAYAGSKGISLGEAATQEKSNEITAIPELLDKIEVAGCVISIDAMGCQKSVAEKIIEKEADYLLAVKQNQSGLYEQIEHLFTLNLGQTSFTTEEVGHGRVEKRTAVLLTKINLLDEADNWPHLKSIVKINTERYIKNTGITSFHTRYYICSSDEFSAEEMNKLVRGHWAIENGLHWQLDVNFGEDSMRKRIGNSAKNFNIILKLVLTLLKRDETHRFSVKRKKLKASYDLEYRELLLNV